MKFAPPVTGRASTNVVFPWPMVESAEIEALRRRSLSNYLVCFWQVVRLLAISFYYHFFVVLNNLIDQDGILEHRVGKLYARRILRRMKHKVIVEGERNIEGLDYFAVASSHASYLDFALLLAYFPTILRFIAKRELRFVPVIGSHLMKRGIVIDRSDHRHAMEVIEAAVVDDNKIPILIFPEGTRSDDGVPKRFKRGGLSLLVKHRVPIVPVTIINTHNYLPKGALRYRKGGTIKLIIGKPLRREDFADDTAMLDAIERTIHETFRREQSTAVPVPVSNAMSR